MRGLLLKDIYLAKKYCRAFLLILLVFAVAGFLPDANAYFIFYPCLIAGVLPVTLISYDERDKWNVYAQTLPFTKAQLVSAKYILGLCSSLLTLAITASAQAFRMVKAGTFAPQECVSLILVLCSICLFTPSVTLPLIFKFGTEKGRLAYYLFIGICFALTSVLTKVKHFALLPGGPAGILAVFAAALLLYGASWALSITFYKKREI